MLGTADVVDVVRALRVLLANEDGTAEEAVAWALARLPSQHHAVVAGEDLSPEALTAFRVFAVGSVVRRRPGRRVSGLP